MKIFFIAVAVVFGLNSPCMGEYRLPAPPVPDSSSPEPFKKVRERLDYLLKTNQLPDFYQELFGFSMSLPGDGWGNVSKTDQYAYLLCSFYAAKAPFISFSYEKQDGIPTVKERMSFDSIDLHVKQSELSFLLSMSYSDSNLLIKKREELGRLSGEYGAALLKSFRELYDPGIDARLDAKKEEIMKKTWDAFTMKWKPWQDERSEATMIRKEKKGLLPPVSEEERQAVKKQYAQWEEERAMTRNGLQRMSVWMGFLSRRSRVAGWMLKSLEKCFVEMLVNYFPGKKGEVVKYIKLAGYGNEEINDLIDRTVGRDGKTEFLYKGRSCRDAR